MAKKSFSIDECDSEDWQGFLEGCVNVEVFHHDWFARSHGGPVKYAKLFKGNEPLAGMVLPTDSTSDSVLFGGLIHGGIVFHKRVFESSVAHINSITFELLTKASEWLMESFASGYISFPSSIIDMRPFQWYRYGCEGPHYQINTRYTGIVQADTYSHAQFSQSRRQEQRLAEKNGVIIEDRVDPEITIQLLKRSMERQGESLSDDQWSCLKQRCLDVVERGGRIYGSRCDGSVTSVMVMADSNNGSVYLYGGQEDHGRNTGAGSLLMASALDSEFSLGRQFVDLEGVNSPRRGYFKMAFGAQLTPYFVVSWDQTNEQ